MFGNRLGWGLSAVLTVVILLVVWQLAKLNRPSPPSRGVVTRTGSVALNLPDNPQLLEPIALPFSPVAVLPAMAEARDAAPVYRQAIERYQADKYAYDRLADSKAGKPRVSSYKQLDALDLLVQARTSASMNLYQADPQQVVDYTSYPPGVHALYTLGRGATQLGMHVMDKDPQQALLLGEAVFSLGHKLATERLRWYEFSCGVELMQGGAHLIGKTDPSRAATAQEAKDQLERRMKDQWVPLWRVISSIDPEVMGRTGGDIFYIAKSSRERMWRIEAVLKLGRYKYDVGRPGHGPNQRWALITVKKMAADQDLDYAVRVAAEAARDLTFERYNMIGGS